jgi:hypothetical protein
VAVAVAVAVPEAVVIVRGVVRGELVNNCSLDGSRISRSVNP